MKIFKTILFFRSLTRPPYILDFFLAKRFDIWHYGEDLPEGHKAAIYLKSPQTIVAAVPVVAFPNGQLLIDV